MSDLCRRSNTGVESVLQERQESVSSKSVLQERQYNYSK